jgi:hypothetical protein
VNRGQEVAGGFVVPGCDCPELFEFGEGVLDEAARPARLSAEAARSIASLGNTLFFSPASLWEIAIKSGRQRPDFTADAGGLRHGLLSIGYTELPITGQHAVAVRGWFRRVLPTRPYPLRVFAHSG